MKVKHKNSRNRGQTQKVICCSCGAKVPRHKAIKVSKYSLPIDDYLYEELKAKKVRICAGKIFLYYCISCARHRRIIK